MCSHNGTRDQSYTVPCASSVVDRTARRLGVREGHHYELSTSTPEPSQAASNYLAKTAPTYWHCTSPSQHQHRTVRLRQAISQDLRRVHLRKVTSSAHNPVWNTLSTLSIARHRYHSPHKGRLQATIIIDTHAPLSPRTTSTWSS
jgi:hypothetical protein